MTHQTELPFSMDEKVGNREAIRANSKNYDYLRKVSIDKIRLRPKFNARRQNGMDDELWEKVLMIPTLADEIFASSGPADPIIGDIAGDGYFYQTEGERRIRAIRHLLRTGRDTYPNDGPVSEVVVMLNPSGTTDLDRKRKIHTTGNKLPLRPMERAFYFRSFKDDNGMTHQEIASCLNVSRQTVDNYIKATDLPEKIQEAIDNDTMKMSTALSAYRKEHAKPRKEGVLVDLEDDDIDPETKLPNVDRSEDEPILTASQEYKRQEEEKKKEKLRGDEDEFEMQDNTVDFAGSKGGPKEDRSSGAHVVGKDTIYMQQQREAVFKRFFNRYNVLLEMATKLIVADKPEDEKDEERSVILFQKRHDHAMAKMMLEYDITVR